MADTDPAGAAREEAAKQAVYVAAMALAVPLLVWVERAAASPDAARQLRMRAELAAEQLLTSLALWAVRQARRARAAYERDRA